MNFIKHIIFGLAIGSGAILPGISSGVLCVVFGIYDKLIHSILSFFSNIKKNFIFLFPIFLGIGIGIILFGNLLEKLFYYFPIPTCFSFIGLILGCIPFLFKKANSTQNGFKLHYILYLSFTFLITIISIKIESTFMVNNIITSPSFSYLLFCGFIMSIGVVVPGVSSTVILMLLGIYPIYLSAISTINLYILIPIGIGLVVGGIIFLKIIDLLFKNFFAETYYSIIGFTLSSIFVLFPGFTFNIQGIISIFLLVICFIIGYLFEK